MHHSKTSGMIIMSQWASALAYRLTAKHCITGIPPRLHRAAGEREQWILFSDNRKNMAIRDVTTVIPVPAGLLILRTFYCSFRVYQCSVW